jgi:hypothetical protein
MQGRQSRARPSEEHSRRPLIPLCLDLDAAIGARCNSCSVTKIEGTVRFLRIDVGDTIEIGEKIDI